MKKILISLTLTVFLNGCVETLAFLGPASTAAGGGNMARSSFTSVVDFGIKKSTGKSSFEHVIGSAKKNNPDKKKEKEKCVKFLEATETEVCSVLKKRVSELKSKIDKNSKIKFLD